MERGINGRAQLLGQSTQVAITAVRVAPELFITIETDIAGVPAPAGVLRIVDRLAGEAIFSPLTPAGARLIAGRLITWADNNEGKGVTDGGSSMHE